LVTRRHVGHPLAEAILALIRKQILPKTLCPSSCRG
jgi:hypothetical protein